MKHPSSSPIPRRENTREKRTIVPVRSFPLKEIKQHFDDNLATIDKQFEFAKSLGSEHLEQAKAIWRSQIVFLESALDFYLHEISKYGVEQIFRNNRYKTDSYLRMTFPMDRIEQAVNNVENLDWLREAANDKFCHAVFLDAGQIKGQLSLLGLNYDEICKNAKIPEDFLQSLFLRRNQIAHQSDRKHEDANLETISEEYVVNARTRVNSFVEAVHSACVVLDSES